MKKKKNNTNKKSDINFKTILFMLVIFIVVAATIAGVTYSYFNASDNTVDNPISGNTGNASLDLTVSLISTNATGKLIPLDNSVEDLTTAALGYNNPGNTFNSTYACLDKDGYPSCQIYQISVTNSSTVVAVVNGGVTSLTGTNTPNVACAVMATNASVTSNSSCVGSNTLASNVTFGIGETKTYYVMVYINNLNQSQGDRGSFGGVVEFSARDGKVTATFNS